MYVNATKVTKNWRNRKVYFASNFGILEEVFNKFDKLGIRFSLEIEPIQKYALVWVPKRHTANLDSILNEIYK